MPYQRYKPQKQWGRYFTRTFRHKSRTRNQTDRLPFYVDPEVTAAGIPIHDPLDPNFFKTFQKETLKFQKPPHLLPQIDEQNPLYKPEACYLFDGRIPLTDGVDEACAIINATSARAFTDKLFRQHCLVDELLPHDFGEKIKNSIMHGERYDSTLERLPKRFDPIIFWVTQKALWGTPVEKRNNVIMCDMYRTTLLTLLHKMQPTLTDFRCDFEAPISSYVASNLSGFSSSLVMKQQPHMVIQVERPLTPLASFDEVEHTKSQQVPDVYPISPIIDLSKTNIYSDTAVLPRHSINKLHISTIFSTRVQNQKYPWTTEQNAANAVMNCFGAALAQATRNGSISEFEDLESLKLKRPVLAKAVQLVDGKFDFAVVQLNTLNLSQNSDGVKNMVWLEKAIPLYKPKPFYENMLEVENFNFDTVRKFVGFLLYR